MEQPRCKVSVACTAFNHGAYIRDALEGFVSQKTDFPFEVLINDDASTDDTAAVIREYAEKYPAIIRPFCQERNLYSQGVNIYDTVLYPAARGQYIALCEGDDYWSDPEKLQRQADFLDAHPDYSACVHNTLLHYTDDSRPDAPLFTGREEQDVAFETVVRGMAGAFHTSSIMARREFLLSPPDFRAVAFRRGFTDYPVGIWLTMRGRVRYLDRCMSVYRVGSNPSAWSSGVDRNYAKFKEFVTGEIEMLRTLLPQVSGDRADAVRQVILEREYELLELQGKVDEQIRPPYDTIYRAQSASYKAKHFLKRRLPGLHRLYRRRRGYGD